MKRLPTCLTNHFEVAVFHKIPKLDGQEVPIDALKFEFSPTEEHLAAVNLVFSSAVKYYSSKSTRNAFQGLDGMAFAYQFTDDLLESENDPYGSGAELLREMVYQVEARIERWVRYLDLYVLNVKKGLVFMKYITCLAWTPKGTIDYAESARRLLKSDLKFEHKMIIACIHCLVDVIDDFITRINPNELTNLYEKTKIVVHFWKNYSISKGSGDVIKIDERMLHAVGYQNADALLFVWSHLGEVTRAENIVKVMEKCDIDLQVYLLSQISGQQQLEMFAKCGSTIVMNMMDDFVWDKYIFVVTYFARDVIPNHQYYLIIRKASAMGENASWSTKNGTLFGELWRNTPQRVKNYIFDEVQDSSLFGYIRKDPSVKEVSELFAEATPSYKQRLLESSDGLRMCQELLAVGEMDFVKSLIDQSFPETEQSYAFKKKLMSYDMKPLTYSLSEVTSLEELDAEVNWFFGTIDEVNDYKKKFIQERTNVRDLSNWLRDTVFESRSSMRSQADFSKINALLEWFTLSEVQIKKVKAMMSSEDSFKSLIVELIENNRYDLADQILQWCFPDAKSIQQFKTSFHRYDINSSIIDAVYNLVWKEDDLESLNKFVDWLYEEQSGKKLFKSSILEKCKTLNNKIWGSLLYKEKFHLADRLLKWALVDDKKIAQYKKDLLLEIDLEFVTERVRRMHKLTVDEEKENDSTYAAIKLKNIIRWFNPTMLTFARFRRKRPDCIGMNAKFHQAIQEFLESSH